MKPVTPRSISPAEAAVVRDALIKAPIGVVAQAMVDQIQTLEVIGRCECGCGSLHFRPVQKGQYRVADGVGYLDDGEKINVMVWAADGHIASLDLVDHLGEGKLPVTVCSWEEAGRIEARK